MTPHPHKANEPVDPDWITRAEAAALIRVSLATIDRYARMGKIRRFRTPGGTPRYDRAEVIGLTEDRAS
jgi:predicted site-specific integrase-resolvase